MKRSAIVLGLLVGAALSASAAHAQNSTNPDLRCAAWAIVASDQEKDPGKRRALGLMMTYFAGRYEQATGAKIEAQIKPQTMKALMGDAEEINTLCVPRANDFGQRLQQTLQGLQAPAKEAQSR